MRSRLLPLLLALGALSLTGCVLPVSQVVPSGGGFASSGLAITKTNIDPSVKDVSAGQVLTLSVETNSSSNLRYAWTASGGSLSSSSANPVKWTAPTTLGAVTVQVEVSSGGDTAEAAFSFRVK